MLDLRLILKNYSSTMKGLQLPSYCLDLLDR